MPVWLTITGTVVPALLAATIVNRRYRRHYGDRASDLKAAERIVARQVTAIILLQIIAFFVALAFGAEAIFAQIGAIALGVLLAIGLVRKPPIRV